MATNPVWNMNILRSCGILYFHFFFGIALILLGWTTFAARWIAKIKPYHRILGQIWVYGMIIQLYSSTYISYNGFKWFIFMFGVICYGSLIIAHLFIRTFQFRLRDEHKSTKYQSVSMDNKIHKDNDREKIEEHEIETDIECDAETENMTNINGTKLNNNYNHKVKDDNDVNKAIWPTQQRLKSIHGIFMFIALIMLTGAGAAFTTRFASTSECVNIYCYESDTGLPDCTN